MRIEGGWREERRSEDRGRMEGGEEEGGYKQSSLVKELQAY